VRSSTSTRPTVDGTTRASTASIAARWSRISGSHSSSHVTRSRAIASRIAASDAAARASSSSGAASSGTMAL
jgi:hypothetical protein